MSEFWHIVYRDTGERVGMASYPSQEAAWRQIVAWDERRLRGGRPDITWEKLERMEPRRVR